MNAVTPVMLAAALLAASGGIFGVAAARLLWAEDLKHAQRIDEIRSRTQAAMQKSIDIYKQRLGE